MLGDGFVVVSYLGRHPWAALGVVVLVLVAIPVYRVTLHPLAKFPGPVTWSISRIPWHASLHRGRLHLDLYDLHMKYGTVVRIAPDELSYAHPDAYRDIYVTRPGHKLLPRNSVWFQRPRNDIQEGVSIMDPDEVGHARLRRAFASAFTEQGVQEMAAVVFKHAKLMVDQLGKVVARAESQGQDGAVIDLVDWFNFTTFDISGELSFGEGFGSIEAEKAHPWVEINHMFGKGVAFIVSLNFMWPLNRLLEFAIPQAVKEKFMYHRRLTTEKVGKRLNEGKWKADFLGSVEKYNEDCQKKGQIDKMVSRSEMDLNMSVLVFAGSETTSSSLSGIFHYLLKDKRVVSKLNEELHANFEKGEDVTVTNVSGLTYLDAVMQEGMRIAPSVVINVPRIIPAGGEEVCGQYLPAKTFVSVAPFAAFRLPENFHDPERFVPERFLEDETSNPDNLQVFQPFGQGRQMCIGHRLAWLMMRVIMVQLLRAFDMEIEGEVGDFGLQRSFIFWEKKPLMVKLRQRD